MDVIVHTTPIKDLLVIEPRVFSDQRGWFLEAWQSQNYINIGIDRNFVQDNMSYSKYGTLRGLHMQSPAQGKLVQVIQGTIFDVAVDLRWSSDTFGKWYGLILSDKNKKQFWIPEGFAHGFFVLSDTAIFSYKCTEYYNPKREFTLLWNDPDIGIDWPLDDFSFLVQKQVPFMDFKRSDSTLYFSIPILSDKDAKGKKLSSLVKEDLD